MIAQETKREYAEGSDFWAAELIATLEEHSLGVAFDWAIETLVQLAYRQRTAEGDLISQFIVELRTAIDSPSIRALIDRADRVLEKEPDNLTFRALGHLMVAREHKLDGNFRRYRTHLVYAMRGMGKHDGLEPDWIDVVVSCAERYLR